MCLFVKKTVLHDVIIVLISALKMTKSSIRMILEGLKITKCELSAASVPTAWHRQWKLMNICVCVWGGGWGVGRGCIGGLSFSAPHLLLDNNWDVHTGVCICGYKWNAHAYMIISGVCTYAYRWGITVLSYRMHTMVEYINADMVTG